MYYVVDITMLIVFPNINKLRGGMVFDTSLEGEARITIKGFVGDLMTWYGRSGTAKSPWGEDLI